MKVRAWIFAEPWDFEVRGDRVVEGKFRGRRWKCLQRYFRRRGIEVDVLS